MTSNSPKSKTLQITKTVMEVLGLVALIVYTIFSALQWQQIKETNQLTRRALDDNGSTLEKTLAKLQGQIDATKDLFLAQKMQAIASQTSAEAAKRSLLESQNRFLLEQRPYVAQTFDTKGVENFFVPHLAQLPSDPTQVQIAWNWAVQNYGKSPAQDVISSVEMTIDGKNYFPAYVVGGASVRPVSITESMVQGQGFFNTAFSAPYSKEFGEQILRSRGLLKIRIKVTYQDVGGKQFVTSICSSWVSGSAMGFCEGNLIR